MSRADTFRKPAPEARAGGTLRIGISRPASVDPGNISDQSGALIASLVCEPLVSLDPVTGRVARGIADEVVVGVRGASFTLTMRSGVKFHNGESVTAQDIVYSLSRVARHDFAGAMSDVLRPVAGYPEIHAPPPPDETKDPAERTLSGVRAISRTALEIALTESNAEFVRALSLPLAAPIPRGLPDENRNFSEQPVCAGPYRMVGPYRPDTQVIKLQRFEDYYGRNEAFVRGGAGYPKTIEFHITADRASEMQAFQEGALDIARVPIERGTVPQNEVIGGELMASPLAALEFVGFPSGHPSLQDPRVRAMLSSAIDRDRLVAEVYAGGRLPADRFVPPALSPSHELEDCLPAPVLDETLLVPLRATNLQFKVNDDFSNRALAEAIAAQWREKLGLTIEVVVIPWDKYLEEATGPAGIDGFFRQSWIPPYASFDAVFHPLFHSSQIGNNNFARFNNRSFDRRLDRVARREADAEVRRLKYLSLEEILCRELPLVPVAFGQEEYLVRTEKISAASGRFFDLSSGLPLVREMFVR